MSRNKGGAEDVFDSDQSYRADMRTAKKGGVFRLHCFSKMVLIFRIHNVVLLFWISVPMSVTLMCCSKR